MKIRQGFVSNSSSSSFIINRSKITYEQDIILRSIGLEKDYRENSITEWKIFLTYGSIIGYTNMDNFDMQAFFDQINIPKEAIYWAKKELNKWVGDNPDYDDPDYFKNEELVWNNARKKMRKALKDLGYKYKPKKD